MKTIMMKAFVHMTTDDWNKGDMSIYPCDDLTATGLVLVGPVDVEYTLPESFNPIAAEVAAIEKKMDEMADKYHAQTRQLTERIESLLCLENKPTVAA